MKLSRIDLIAQNGNEGQHYKYEETAKKILDLLWGWDEQDKNNIIKILMEAFPDDL